MIYINNSFRNIAMKYVNKLVFLQQLVRNLYKNCKYTFLMKENISYLYCFILDVDLVEVKFIQHLLH